MQSTQKCETTRRDILNNYLAALFGGPAALDIFICMHNKYAAYKNNLRSVTLRPHLSMGLPFTFLCNGTN